MKMRRLLACIMALLLSASLPVSALADTYDLAEGSVSVNASESGQTVTHKEETRPDSAPVITQSGSSETATAHTVTIEAGAGFTANVTLDGVNISADGAAIQTSGSGDVVIELDGENTVQSGEGHAGVEKNNSGSLTITDKNGEAGSLTATGGAGGAGIGGGAGSGGSKITISGGTVEAAGSAGGAGIGGGDGRGGSNITISGGSVTATGGDAPSYETTDGMVNGEGGGAGIGGGAGSNGSKITISGGTVEAAGSAGGAGIGGGDGGNGGIIRINGGTVTAQGGTGGSGIGGGNGGEGSKITIRGGTVAATGGEGGSGIGGGEDGDGSDIVISGGSVTATGGDAPSYETTDGMVNGEGGGAGIGGGSYGTGRNITIANDAVVTATGKGNASNIGFGHPKDSTGQFPDRMDVSKLTPSGSVNGVPGSYNPNANDGDADETDDRGRDFPNGSALYNGPTIVHRELLELTNSYGQNLSYESLVKDDAFIFTVAANNAILTGNRDALQSLKDQGAEKTVLETNRMTVSVSNDLLMNITNDGESFQLRTEGTGFSLTTTDQNHKKKFDMKLTTDGTQEEQQETQKDTQGMIAFELDVSQPPNDDSLNRLLHLLSTLDQATLTSTGGSLQILKEQGIGSTALTAGDLTIGFNISDVLKQIDANFDSKLDSASVILNTNGVQNDDGVYHGKLTASVTDVGSDETGNQVTVDMSDCSWMTKYFTNFRVQDG